MAHLHVGQRCEVLSATGKNSSGLRASLKRFGEIAFIGTVDGLPDGEWIGIRLDQPLGKNDGTYNNHRYFDCLPLHGVFTRREKINVDGEFPVFESQSDTFAYGIEARRKQTEAKKNQQAQERLATQGKSMDQLVQDFWQSFTTQEDAIRKQVELFIDQKKQPVATSSQEASLDALVLQVTEMREDAAKAASLYLSPYDVRQTQLIITRLLEYIENTRTVFAPRKKFTFRSRAKTEQHTPKMHESPEVDVPHRESQSSSAATLLMRNLDELVFADKENEVILIDASTFDADSVSKRRDLSFSRLRNCVICITVETSAIRGDDLHNCVVFAGPVWGSLWLEHCVNCDFFVACRQLRVHHSAKTTFHLRINSHPIIEDCHQLQFGPYRLRYNGLEAQLEAIGLARESGMFAKVNDFKWHRAQQSPNWSLVDPKAPMREIPSTVAHLISYD